MHPVDKERNDKRLAAARADLSEAMAKPPFDLSSAGATRVQAWKKALVAAHQLLAKNTSDPYKIEDAARAIRACGTGDLGQLASAAYGPKR